MPPLEIFAATLGVISVYLTAKQHSWCWPVGAIMVALYAYIFFETKLYADMALQIAYFFLQFYGWYQWRRGAVAHTELRVTRTPLHLWVRLIVAAVIFTSILGYSLSTITDASLPYLDSGITGFSLVAQYMVAKKKLENWIVWACVDSFSIYVFWTKDLYATAVLYLIFLALCLLGYRAWRRVLA